MSTIDKKLAELGVTIPEASAPAANYVPYVITGNQIIISGQLPFRDGSFDHSVGRLGSDFTPEQGAEIARDCAINIVAQAKSALGGDLDRVTRVVRLGGFVNSDADFTAQPVVINGASNFMVDVFGDAGRHARTAVSASSLPFGVAVEIDAIIEFK